MEKHYWKIVKDSDERVIHSLRVQEKNPSSWLYGGFYDKDGMVQAKYAIYRVATMISAYCNPDSTFYRNQKVYDSICLGLDYVRSVQHESGLFDYITCNFSSAPDTAFCLKKLIPVFEYLKMKQDKSPEETTIYEKSEGIVRSGSYGLLQGGFHTPNHRWAIASSLVEAYKFFGDEQFKTAAFDYLKEGIDCNEDGEFAEKSAGNYNRVNNDAMITLSEVLGDDFYDQCAVKNLWLMLKYWEPDDSVFTANSTRFDKDLLVYPRDYYIEYIQMGMKYQIPEFLQMCNKIFDIIGEKRIKSPDILIWFMLHPEYRTLEFEGSYQQSDFRKYCSWSGIFRGRKGNFTYTVMKEKSNFLYFHNGTIKLAMKIGGSFCEHRAFKAETMEVQEDGTIHLHQTMRGWYYLPFEEKQDTSDWWAMDQSKRKKKMGPDMDIDVYVTEVSGGLDVRVKTSGVDGAPWRIELAFNGVDYMENEHMAFPVTGSEVVVVKDGMLEAANGRDSVKVGPAFGAHRFTEGKEDSEAKTPGAATIYFTDYTGFDHTIQIRNNRDCMEK